MWSVRIPVTVIIESALLSMVGSEATLASGLPPPLLGEHTDAIPTSLLGLDAGTIPELRRNGVV